MASILCSRISPPQGQGCRREATESHCPPARHFPASVQPSSRPPREKRARANRPFVASKAISRRPHLRQIGPGGHSTCRRGKDSGGNGQNEGRVGNQSGVEGPFAANAADAYQGVSLPPQRTLRIRMTTIEDIIRIAVNAHDG